MDLRFLNGGYCRQLLALVDRRSWRWVRFHAVFLAVHHPDHGWIVIDTGYGDRFADATHLWPYRLYRYATPARMNGTATATLARAGIDAAQVRHVIITHFHADHIGGLSEFPNATIHYHADAWRTLASLTPFRQVHAAFLPALVPDWLTGRSHVIEQSEFALTPDLPFPIYDLFGDGAFRLVSLPGHAPGHLGLLLETADKPKLYATDAFWNWAQIGGSVDLLPPVLRFQWDGQAYQKTVHQLRDVARGGQYSLLACHAPETQASITDANAPTR
jgi:glyoxylase-like metal-dependent hydrolase (beta-lactamase superfamily II)